MIGIRRFADRCIADSVPPAASAQVIREKAHTLAAVFQYVFVAIFICCGRGHDIVAGIAFSGCASALAYLDDTDSYSTNEIAIYWNTPFLYLLSSYMVEYK